jgi:hypothetical protein
MFVIGLPPLGARLGGTPRAARRGQRAAPASVRTFPAAGAPDDASGISRLDTNRSKKRGQLTGSCGPTGRRSARGSSGSPLRPRPRPRRRLRPHRPGRWRTGPPHPTMRQAFQDSTQIGARNEGPLTGSCGPTGRRSARGSLGSPRPRPRRRLRPHRPGRWRTRRCVRHFKTRHKLEQETRGRLPALAARLGDVPRAARRGRLCVLVLVPTSSSAAPAAVHTGPAAGAIHSKTRIKSEQETKGSLPALAAQLGGAPRAARQGYPAAPAAVCIIPAAGAHDDKQSATHTRVSSIDLELRTGIAKTSRMNEIWAELPGDGAANHVEGPTKC